MRAKKREPRRSPVSGVAPHNGKMGSYLLCFGEKGALAKRGGSKKKTFNPRLQDGCVFLEKREERGVGQRHRTASCPQKHKRKEARFRVSGRKRLLFSER